MGRAVALLEDLRRSGMRVDIFTFWQRLPETEPRFPGLPNHGAQFSYRNQGSATFRTTLTPNLVSETVGGLIWSPVNFFADETPAMFANQGGFGLNLSGGTAFASVSNATAGSNTNNSATRSGRMTSR